MEQNQNFSSNLQSAIALFAEGNFVDSLHSFKALYQAVCEAEACDPVQELVLLNIEIHAIDGIGGCFFGLGQLKPASEIYLLLIERIEASIHSEKFTEIYLNCKMNLGSCEISQSRFTAAISIFLELKELLSKNEVDRDLSLELLWANIHERLGVCFRNLGHQTDAVKSYQTAIESFEFLKKSGIELLEIKLAGVWTKLGVAQAFVGKSHLAEQAFLTAKELLCSAAVIDRPEGDVQRFNTALNLGEFYSENNKFGPALKEFEFAEKIQSYLEENDNVSNFPEKAKLLANKAKVLQQMQRFPEAQKAAEYAVEIFEHPDVCERQDTRSQLIHSQSCLATCYLHQGHYENALEKYDALIQRVQHDIKLGINGVRVELGKLQLDKGVALERIGEHLRAVEAFENALENFNLADTDRQNVLWQSKFSSLINKGICHSQAGQYLEALESYWAAETLFQQVDDVPLPFIKRQWLSLHLNESATLSHMGSYALAAEEGRKIAGIFNEFSNDEKISNIEIYVMNALNLGNCLMQEDKGTSAVDIFDQAINLITHHGLLFVGSDGVQKSNFDPLSIPALVWRSQLLAGKAQACIMSGKLDAALECTTEVKKVLEFVENRSDRFTLDISLLVTSLECEALRKQGLHNQAFKTGTRALDERNLTDIQSEEITLRYHSHLLAELALACPKNMQGDTWFENNSDKFIQILDLLPPSLLHPWKEIRHSFQQFHNQWLEACVSQEKWHMIPSILAAKQASELFDIQIHEIESDLQNSELVSEYISARKEAQELAQKVASYDTSSQFYVKHSKDDNEDGLLWDLQRNIHGEFRNARLRLQKEKLRVQQLSAFRWLKSNWRVQQTKRNFSLLQNTEAVIVLFSDDDQAHFVCYGGSGDFAHFQSVDVKMALAEIHDLNKFSTSLNARGRIVNLDAEDEMDLRSENLKRQSRAFDQFAQVMRRDFWKPFRKKFPNYDRLVISLNDTFLGAPVSLYTPHGHVCFGLLPGISWLFETDRLFVESQGSKKQTTKKVVSLFKDTPNDLQMASSELQICANLWEKVGAEALLSNSYPTYEDQLDFVHIVSHCMSYKNILGISGTGISSPTGVVESREIVVGPVIKRVFLNTCLAGVSFQNEFNGALDGVVSSFLRRGTNELLAPICPINDYWATLFGILITEALSLHGKNLREALSEAQGLARSGQWSNQVNFEFKRATLALLEATPKQPDGNTNLTILQEIEEILGSGNSDVQEILSLLVTYRNSREELWWFNPNEKFVIISRRASNKITSLLVEQLDAAFQSLATNGVPNRLESKITFGSFCFFGSVFERPTKFAPPK